MSNQKQSNQSNTNKNNSGYRDSVSLSNELCFHEIKSDAPNASNRTAVVWAKTKAEATDLIESVKKGEKEPGVQPSVKVLQYREIPQKEIQVLLGKNEPNPSTLKIKYCGKELTFGPTSRVQYL